MPDEEAIKESGWSEHNTLVSVAAGKNKKSVDGGGALSPVNLEAFTQQIILGIDLLQIV